MRFIWQLKTQVFNPDFSLPGSAVDRTRSRSTETVDRMCTKRAQGHLVWPVDRAVDRLKATHSRVSPVDRAVDRPRAVALWFRGRSTGRSTGSWQRSNFDRWPVDRPVDRMVKSDHNCCQWLVFKWGYKYPISGQFFLRFEELIFSYSLVFSQQSKEVFEL